MKLNINVNNMVTEYLHFSWDAMEIARSVYERAICDVDNKYDAKDKLYEALCDEMIWTKNQWTIMAEYQSPEEADYGCALDRFYDDLWSRFDSVIEEEE